MKAIKISMNIIQASQNSRKVINLRTPLTLTKNASSQIGTILSKHPGKALKIGVKSSGCSGLSYFLDYADKKQKLDEEVNINNKYKLYIENKAQMTLLGAEMDYIKNDLKSEFVFNNTKIKGVCGCGESFHI
ncbi:hypothetical protein A3Q56_04208 [Intoshia linei]|uniref:Iron-sulfur cluster assembly 1 homolog, mitochondrial n=1 Tax=Intoshia linei TaxID=1819745 RepID=A0A177B1G4_9BILA|nr:hypothetical protein A3Q56_04208 [Intoshia linei]